MNRIRIPTRTNSIRRVASAFWQACDDHQWLPLTVVIVALLLVNSTLFN